MNSNPFNLEYYQTLDGSFPDKVLNDSDIKSYYYHMKNNNLPSREIYTCTSQSCYRLSEKNDGWRYALSERQRKRKNKLRKNKLRVGDQEYKN